MDNGASSYRRFLDGDESAFNEIMEELFRSLVFFINGYVHDIHAAEDIAIDAFSDLVVHRHRYNFKVTLKTYVFMLGRSRALDYIKHRKVLSFVELSEAEGVEDEKTLEEIVLADERKRTVHSAIAKLSEDKRVVIHLWVEFTVTRIGDTSGDVKKTFVDFVPQYIRTNGYYEDVEYPVVKIIRSVDELNSYYNENKEKYSLERREDPASDSTIGFLDACDKYNAEYFEKQILVMVLLEEGSGSVARTVIPMPYEIKLNGTLSDEWCVGDQITATYTNVYYDDENKRVEVDFTSVEASDWQPDPGVAYKPVIYLYPEVETEVSVKLDYNGNLVCTYPAYKDGWTVTAAPDGTLTDANGQTYNYLYWEGESYAQYDLSKGFCVKGEDTAAFLEGALEQLGLTRREANEFIVYWLPLMEQNLYNIISFQTDIYTDNAKLMVDPAPDTLIRVFMAWQSADEYVELEKQDLTAPDRTGFTVVEWGGTEIK